MTGHFIVWHGNFYTNLDEYCTEKMIERTYSFILFFRKL
ncbi:hypothetical protein B4135_3151 [Caldibacillus debilis]|uniref:Uncharacterized protein n=1 Tax=Caldibacillus debilis TaxID=301148 RepID=A0A150LJ63_9BACI|nr:hypothetical protein B4135_3151 [Caldibacillus debilis]